MNDTSNKIEFIDSDNFYLYEEIFEPINIYKKLIEEYKEMVRDFNIRIVHLKTTNCFIIDGKDYTRKLFEYRDTIIKRYNELKEKHIELLKIISELNLKDKKYIIKFMRYEVPVYKPNQISSKNKIKRWKRL
jgi:hypothetical protein